MLHGIIKLTANLDVKMYVGIQDLIKTTTA